MPMAPHAHHRSQKTDHSRLHATGAQGITSQGLLLRRKPSRVRVSPRDERLALGEPPTPLAAAAPFACAAAAAPLRRLALSGLERAVVGGATRGHAVAPRAQEASQPERSDREERDEQQQSEDEERQRKRAR